MWILTDDKTMINTDNIIHMDIEDSGVYVYIKAYFNGDKNVTSGPIGYRFCILDNTKNNRENVKRIFNEIFDSMYSGQKTFNIPKRLLGKN